MKFKLGERVEIRGVKGLVIQIDQYNIMVGIAGCGVYIFPKRDVNHIYCKEVLKKMFEKKAKQAEVNRVFANMFSRFERMENREYTAENKLKALKQLLVKVLPDKILAKKIVPNDFCGIIDCTGDEVTIEHFLRYY